MGSLNPALLRTAREKAPPGMRSELYDIWPLQFYDADSEYHHGIPGVLKNALSWASHPHRDSAGL